MSRKPGARIAFGAATGFILSLLFLSVATAYAFLPQNRASSYAVFVENDRTNGMPTPFLIAAASFALLNVPAVLVSESLFHRVRVSENVAPNVKPILLPLLLMFWSALWWWLLYVAASRFLKRTRR